MHAFGPIRLRSGWNLLPGILPGIIAIAGLSVGGCGSKPAPTAVAPAAPAVSEKPADAQVSPQPDVDDTIATIDSIGSLGSKGKESLPSLLAALGDPKPSVRWHAARSIGLVGEAAVSAIPQLIVALSDADPIVATQAAAALGRIRSDDGREPSKIDAETAALYESAVKPLAGCIVHKDPRVRRAAIRSLQVIHPDEDALIELANSLLTDEDPSVVFPALHSLADMGDEAVPFLVKSLDHPKARYWAMLVLAEIGPAATAAVPKLTALAAKGEPEERLQAIMGLASIGEPAAGAVDTLVGVVRSKAVDDMALHPATVYAIGRIRSEKAFEDLEPLLKAENQVLAATAAWARARIRPDDATIVAEAVDRLEKGLDSPDATIRQGAVSALSDLVNDLPAGEGKPLAERYAALLEDTDPEVRRSAAVALVRLGAEAVEPVTRSLDDPQQRPIAIEILTEMGAIARPALPKLIEALDDANPTVRSDAAFAIAALGPDAAEAVPALVERLGKEAALAAAAGTDSGNEDVGGVDAEQRAGRAPLLTVAYALVRIGKASKPAVETLHRMIESPDPFMATIAAWAGLKIEPDRKDLYAKAVPLLTKALKSDRDLARMEAASALGDFGSAASGAVAMLEMVAEDDPVAAVREAAEEALEQIRGKP